MGVKDDRKFVSTRAGQDIENRESKEGNGKNKKFDSDGGAGSTQLVPQSTNLNLNISTFDANLSTAADYKPNRMGTLKQNRHKLKRKFGEVED